jgi:hypothetical protein
VGCFASGVPGSNNDHVIYSLHNEVLYRVGER